jgi:hypothetical protein
MYKIQTSGSPKLFVSITQTVTLVLFGLLLSKAVLTIKNNEIYCEKFVTITNSLTSLTLTAKSLIFHGIKHKYNKYVSKLGISSPDTILSGDYLKDQNIIVFVHGRNGAPTDFEGLINNVYESKSINFHDKKCGCIELQNGQKFILRFANLRETGYSSIDEDVSKLSKQLENYVNCNIILVGASKGGLIASRYAVTQKDSRIKNVITLSSPLKGTRVVDLFFGKHSPVYQALGYYNDIAMETEMLVSESNTQFYHVVPTYDHLIIPSEVSYYENTPENCVYRYTGYKYSHAGIVDNPEVAVKLLNWVENMNL